MNKYQEALAEIEETCLCIDSVSDVDVYLNPIRELVEKTTPKKAIKADEQNIRFVTTYICPNCNKEFTGKISNYCYHCGQKIDWSDDGC